MGEQHIEPGEPETAEPLDIADERAESGHDLVERENLAATVTIEAEGDVAELGQPLDAALDVVVDSRRLVAEQHRRAFATLRLVVRQASEHLDAVVLVLDILDMHGAHPTLNRFLRVAQTARAGARGSSADPRQSTKEKYRPTSCRAATQWSDNVFDSRRRTVNV